MIVVLALAAVLVTLSAPGTPTGSATATVASPTPALAPQADAAATPAERTADEVHSFGKALTGDLAASAPRLEVQAASTSSTSSSTTARTAAVSFPALSSMPSATRTLFLNFRGTTVTGTGWNSSSSRITVAPYDTDGRPTVTTAAEAAVVNQVWRRVVEDYSAYNLNVTTVAPAADKLNRTSSSDQTFGSTVIVSNETFYQSSCQCGGIAYTGTFDMVGNDAYNEAWVFTRAVGKGARNIAEAATHESAHTLGLSHDGTSHDGYYAGQGSWAPVMGSAYARPITQFSRGEYAGATNREDDLAILAEHGLTLRRDEAGSANSTSIAMPSSRAAAGVITTSGDADGYRVSLGRRKTTVSVNVAPYGPNLDVQLVVRDSAGRTVASANPAIKTVNANTATGQSASVTFTPEAAGTYYVVVRGSGYGSARSTGYSAYGSTGAYTVRWTA